VKRLLGFCASKEKQRKSLGFQTHWLPKKFENVFVISSVVRHARALYRRLLLKKKKGFSRASLSFDHERQQQQQ